jgi:hypothetical protein
MKEDPMLRTACVALAISLLAPMTTARAASLEGLKVKLKQDNRKRVVVRLEVPALLQKRLKKQRAKFKVNVYAGKTADETKRIKNYKWKFSRRTRKWAFKRKNLCKKGLRHIRVKVKPNVPGQEHESITKRLELDC